MVRWMYDAVCVHRESQDKKGKNFHVQFRLWLTCANPETLGMSPKLPHDPLKNPAIA